MRSISEKLEESFEFLNFRCNNNFSSIVRCLKRLAQRREIYEAIEGNDLSISSSPRFVNGCCTLLEKKIVQVVRRSSGTISNIRVL